MFVSLAYVVAWVADDLGHDPGYGGFLSNSRNGSLEEVFTNTPSCEHVSVDSLVWDATT